MSMKGPEGVGGQSNYGEAAFLAQVALAYYANKRNEEHPPTSQASEKAQGDNSGCVHQNSNDSFSSLSQPQQPNFPQQESESQSPRVSPRNDSGDVWTGQKKAAPSSEDFNKYVQNHIKGQQARGASSAGQKPSSRPTTQSSPKPSESTTDTDKPLERTVSKPKLPKTAEEVEVASVKRQKKIDALRSAALFLAPNIKDFKDKRKRPAAIAKTSLLAVGVFAVSRALMPQAAEVSVEPAPLPAATAEAVDLNYLLTADVLTGKNNPAKPEQLPLATLYINTTGEMTVKVAAIETDASGNNKDTVIDINRDMKNNPLQVALQQPVEIGLVRAESVKEQPFEVSKTDDGYIVKVKREGFAASLNTALNDGNVKPGLADSFIYPIFSSEVIKEGVQAGTGGKVSIPKEEAERVNNSLVGDTPDTAYTGLLTHTTLLFESIRHFQSESAEEGVNSELQQIIDTRIVENILALGEKHNIKVSVEFNDGQYDLRLSKAVLADNPTASKAIDVFTKAFPVDVISTTTSIVSTKSEEQLASSESEG